MTWVLLAHKLSSLYLGEMSQLPMLIFENFLKYWKEVLSQAVQPMPQTVNSKYVFVHITKDYTFQSHYVLLNLFSY